SSGSPPPGARARCAPSGFLLASTPPGRQYTGGAATPQWVTRRRRRDASLRAGYRAPMSARIAILLPLMGCVGPGAVADEMREGLAHANDALAVVLVAVEPPSYGVDPLA